MERAMESSCPASMTTLPEALQSGTWSRVRIANAVWPNLSLVQEIAISSSKEPQLFSPTHPRQFKAMSSNNFASRPGPALKVGSLLESQHAAPECSGWRKRTRRDHES